MVDEPLHPPGGNQNAIETAAPIKPERKKKKKVSSTYIHTTYIHANQAWNELLDGLASYPKVGCMYVCMCQEVTAAAMEQLPVLPCPPTPTNRCFYRSRSLPFFEIYTTEIQAPVVNPSLGPPCLRQMYVQYVTRQYSLSAGRSSIDMTGTGKAKCCNYHYGHYTQNRSREQRECNVLLRLVVKRRAQLRLVSAVPLPSPVRAGLNRSHLCTYSSATTLGAKSGCVPSRNCSISARRA